MNGQDARAAVHRAINQVAPDVGPEDLEAGARLRQALTAQPGVVGLSPGAAPLVHQAVAQQEL